MTRERRQRYRELKKIRREPWPERRMMWLCYSIVRLLKHSNG